MTWLWIVGAAVLASGAVVPPMLVRRRGARRDYVTARDRAHSAMSRLEAALDRTGNGGPEAVAGVAARAPSAEAVAEARRCFTLAGSALAGPDTTAGFQQAEGWARQGLSSLGVPHEA